MAEIEKLLLTISADVSALKKKLDEAARDTERFSAHVGGIGRLAATALAAVGTAAVGAATSVFVMAKSAGATAETLTNLSTQLGESTEFLSALSHVAELSNLSLDDLRVGLGQLTRNMLEAATGSTQAQQTFALLGLSVQNADGSLRSVSDVMLDAADRLSQMQDAAARAGLAQELFGRSGLRLLPVLAQGSAALREQMEEARQLGLVWSGPVAEAASLFDDHLTRLSGVLTGLRNAVAIAVIPALNALIERFLSWSRANSEVIRSRISDWVQTFASRLGPLVDRVLALGRAVAFLTGLFSPLVDVLGRVAALLWHAFVFIGATALNALLSAIRLVIAGADVAMRALGKEGFTGTLQELDEHVAALNRVLRESGEDALQQFGIAVGKVPDMTANAMQRAAEAAEQGATGIRSAITRNLGAEQEGLGRAITQNLITDFQLLAREAEAAAKEQEGLGRAIRQNLITEFQLLARETEAAARQQERFGQALVAQTKLEVELLERREAKRREAIATLQGLERELALAAAPEHERAVAEIEALEAKRIAIVNEAVQTRLAILREEASETDDISFQMQQIFEERNRALQAIFADTRRRLDEAFKVDPASIRAFEQELVKDLQSASEQRLAVIEQELSERLARINQFALEATEKERLITLAHEAAAKKRKDVMAEETTWTQQALTQVQQAFSQAWGMIVANVTGSIARVIVEGGKLKLVFQQVAIGILQSFLTLTIQLLTQWIVMEMGRAAATTAANATIAASTKATGATMLAVMTAVGTGIKVLFLGLARAVVGVVGLVVSGVSVVLNSISTVVGFMLATIGQVLIQLGTALQSVPIIGNIIGAILIGAGTLSIALGAALPGIVAGLTGALTTGVAALEGKLTANAALALAHGGIVTDPTLALIGEAGPEAVVPLSRGGAFGDQTIIIELDGRTMARATLPFLPGEVRLRAGAIA